MKRAWFLIFVLIFLLLSLGVIFLMKPKRVDQNFVSQTKMKISSPAFENNGLIPKRYTCDGENINPPLYFEEVPPEAKSLVLIVDDPDAPRGTFLHWLVFNIPPETKLIEENSLPAGAKLGRNDFGSLNYGGPCPPSGIHRYYFKLYALDTILDLKEGCSLKEVLGFLKDHLLRESYLVGLYKRE